MPNLRALTRSAALIAATGFAAMPAAADSLGGLSYGLAIENYVISAEDDSESASTASLTLGYGSFIAQVDYSNSPGDQFTAWALTLGYEVTEALVLGAFVRHEDWTGDFYPAYGLRANYDGGIWDIEAVLAQYQDEDGDGVYFTVLDLSGSYAVADDWAVTGSLMLTGPESDQGYENQQIYQVGLRHTPAAGVLAELNAARVIGDGYDSNVLEFRIAFDLIGERAFTPSGWYETSLDPDG